MKKYSLYIVVISVVILLFGCNEEPKSNIQKDAPYVVDFEQCMATEQEMKISEIADTVEYLELKTPKDLIITRIWNIIPIDDILIIHSRDGVFKFTRKGEFIKSIGRSGQGPGEYSMILCIDVDLLNKEIVIADSGKLLFYDLNGTYLRTKKWGFLTDIGFSDSALWVCTSAIHIDKEIAFALSREGDTIASILNPCYGMKSLNNDVRSSTPRLSKTFYRHKGSLYLKGVAGNDTIYQLAGTKNIPHAYINRGKYKLPHEYQPWYSWDEFNKHGNRYWGIPAIAEDERYLYLLTQRFRSIDGINYGHNEENFRYIVYDKQKGEGFVTKNEKGAKITDDILGAPPIWPYMITDDYYMNVIEWYDLSEELKKGEYTLSPALEKQIAGFGYSTNQLIV